MIFSARKAEWKRTGSYENRRFEWVRSTFTARFE